MENFSQKSFLIEQQIQRGNTIEFTEGKRYELRKLEERIRELENELKRQKGTEPLQAKMEQQYQDYNFSTEFMF